MHASICRPTALTIEDMSHCLEERKDNNLGYIAGPGAAKFTRTTVLVRTDADTEPTSGLPKLYSLVKVEMS